MGECMMKPFDPNKCPLELLDGDIGNYDIQEDIWGGLMTVTALQKAEAILKEMLALYNSGNTDRSRYYKIVERYANMSVSSSGSDFKFTLNGKAYTMYMSFTEKRDYYRFSEDCTMMVYRLNGGEGHTTMSLVKLIKEKL